MPNPIGKLDRRRSTARGTPQLRLLQTMGSASVEIGDAYDLLKKVPAKSVDLVLTSPPYWGQRTYGGDHDWKILDRWVKAGGGIEKIPPYEWYRDNGGVLGLEPSPDWFVEHLAEILALSVRCLKPGGSLWVNLGDTYFARWASIRDAGRQGLGGNPRVRRRVPMGDYRQEKQLLLIPARFAIAMQSRRWILRNDMIWFKPNVPPRPETDRLRLSHEHFFHFALRPKEGRAKYHYDIKEVEDGAHDVVTCTVKAGRNGHSATFPEQLIRPRILSSCPLGGVVLDPFSGTGRTLEVSIREGRNAIGFELSESQAKASREHLRSLSP